MAQAPNELDAVEALAAIAAGRLTAEALTRACLERIAARDSVVHAFAYLDPGARARRSPRARPRARSARTAARAALRREGHHRHARHADALRLADSCRPPAVRRCGMRGAGARGRRRDAGQDGHDGIRVAPSRTDGEPAQSCAHARADRRADRPPPSPTSWCRWRSARRPADRSSAPLPIAAWSATSLRSTRSTRPA